MGLFGPAWMTKNANKLDKALKSLDGADSNMLKDAAAKAPLEEVAIKALEDIEDEGDLAFVAKNAQSAPVAERAARKIGKDSACQGFLYQIAMSPNGHDTARLAALEGLWLVNFVEEVAEDSPSAEVRAIAQDTMERLRQAEDPATPAGVLAQLAEDDVRSVRAKVAKNPSTPPDVLAELSADEWSGVRMDAAANPSTPEKKLKLLARDKDRYVRMEVVNNPSAPVELIEELLWDSEYVIRMAADQKLSERSAG